MNISGVDFPTDLLKALRDSDLVVFAGAGVSMGPPASLPNFSGLAKEVAAGTGEVRGEDEPEDRFLGRLQHNGVLVHERAAQELSGRRGEPSLPNDLHLNILKLYPRPESLRVVTTNFDLLFEQAASGVFETVPTTYSAPVLPLGEDFEGIVHVHGDINRPDNTVLTDVDFGRAYLTQGWARRFLVALFSSFPVLFIGYSHNDVVMNYLARALTVSDKRRYVLAASDEDEAERKKWEFLGIRRIEYLKWPDDDHRGLQEAISGLADLVRRDSSDWRIRITEIAEQPPSDDEEQMDLIDFAFSDAGLTRHFTAADTPPEWIGWLAKREDIGGLFTTDIDYNLDERDRHLSRWLAEKFARKQADQLFDLIDQHGMRLHRDLWWWLGRVIGGESGLPMEPKTLSRWVSLFLSTPPPLSDEHIFAWVVWLDLGKRCMEADLTNSCIDIFEHMAGSHLELDRPFAEFAGRYFKPEIRVELKPVCDHATINGLWDKVLKPGLENVAEPLLSRIVAILEKRHRVLHAWQAATRAYDPQMIRRNSVTPQEDIFYPEPFDVLIDAARDCLEHLLENHLESAIFWCDHLVRADPPFLRKLAVNALSVRKDMSEVEKIDWLLKRHDILDDATENETIQVLRAVYTFATPQQRETVIGDVLAFRWPDEEDEESEDKAAYEHFHWFYRLHQIDPDCTLTKEALDRVWSDYPNYRPREEPGTATWSEEEWPGHQSPWSVEELLAHPAGEWVDNLLSFQQVDFLGPDREGLLEAVKNAATQDFEWGFQLAETLAAIGNWQTDLWPPLMTSWCGELDREQHRRVLGYLQRPYLHPQHGQSVIEVLTAVVRDESNPCPPDLLSETNRIAKRLGRFRNQVELDSNVDNWLFQARNNVAGKLAVYWLVSFDAWRKQQNPSPEQMNHEYRTVFSEIIFDTTLAGTLGKAILARYSAFLLETDEKWTKSQLLPLFGNVDNMQAYQAVWDGYAEADKTMDLAELLKEFFLEAISLLNTHFSGRDRRENLVHGFTFMLINVVSDPDEILNDWIPRFFTNTEEGERIKFAQEITSRIRRMEDVQQREWWDHWLGRYFENRLQGVPATLSSGEVEVMLNWLPHFTSLFPRAVELAVQLPPSQLNLRDVLFGIKQRALWETYPESVATLLVFLDKFTLPPWVWNDDGKELIAQLLELDLSDDVKRSLLALAARRGLHRAAQDGR